MIRLGAITLAGACAVSALAAEWQPSAPLPRAVAGHASAARDGALWVVGGSFWDGGVKRIESAIWRRGAAARSWEQIGTIEGGFAHGGAFAADGALWLAGGLAESGPLAVVRRVDLASGAVREIAHLPEPRAYCGTTLLNGTLWVIGGTAVDADYARTSTDWWQVDTRTGSVRRGPERGPAIINPVVLAFGSELHVLPGSVWSPERSRLDAPLEVMVYSVDEGKWRRHPLGIQEIRGMSGVAIDARHGLLAGGLELRGGGASFTAQTWTYDAAERRLTAGPALPSPRLAASIAADGIAAWLSGGEDGPRSRAPTVWKLTLADLARTKR